MDGVSAVVVLLFVFSIFSSVGGGKLSSPSEILVADEQQAVLQDNFPTIEPNFSYTFNSQGALEEFIKGVRNTGEAGEIAASIVRHSETYNVNPKLVAALMARESRFNPRATSSSGAMGLGQLLPATAENMKITDGYDIDQNTKGTVRYIRYLLDRFQNRTNPAAYAIAGYLEGPNAIARTGLVNTHTRSYVRDILANYSKI